MSPRSSFGGNVAVTLTGNLITPLAALGSAPVLAHGLGLADRGAVAGVTAPLMLLVAVAALGLPESVTYFTARGTHAATRISLQTAVVLVTVSGTVSAVAVWVSREWLLGNAGDLDVALVIALAALVPSLWIGVARGVAAGRLAWRTIAVERSVVAVSRLATLSVLLLADRLTVVTATAVLALTPLVGGLIYAIRLIECGNTEARELTRSARSKVRDSELLTYAVKVWFGSMSGILLSRLDQVLMIPLSSSSELGIYVAAVTVSELPLILTASIREVLFSSDATASDDGLLQRAGRASNLLVLVICAVLGANLFWFIPVFFGSDFAPAVAVALTLLLGVVLGNPGSVAGAGLSSRGHPGLRSFSLAVACVVNIAGIFLFVPSHGAMGAAIATVVGNLSACALNLVFYSRYLQLRPVELLRIRRDDLSLLWSMTRRLFDRLRSSR